MLGETADSCAHNRQPLGSEQGGLELRARPVAADPSAGCNDAMVGEAGHPRDPHDVADGPGSARAAGHDGDIPIRGDTPGWNAPKRA
jgi:hypothetical protein